MSAADLQSLQQLVPEMEAAWREGRVTLAQRTLVVEQAVAA
jgi:hypothetical protein